MAIKLLRKLRVFHWVDLLMMDLYEYTTSKAPVVVAPVVVAPVVEAMVEADY